VPIVKAMRTPLHRGDASYVVSKNSKERDQDDPHVHWWVVSVSNVNGGLANQRELLYTKNQRGGLLLMAELVILLEIVHLHY
jgi:hypothetical protein